MVFLLLHATYLLLLAASHHLLNLQFFFSSFPVIFSVIFSLHSICLRNTLTFNLYCLIHKLPHGGFHVVEFFSFVPAFFIYLWLLLIHPSHEHFHKGHVHKPSPVYISDSLAGTKFCLPGVPFLMHFITSTIAVTDSLLVLDLPPSFILQSL